MDKGIYCGRDISQQKYLIILKVRVEDEWEYKAF